MLEKAAEKIKRDPRKATAYLPAWTHHPVGYPRLSERISFKPETGIYRRFDGLNARHLLYLQAELCTMEKNLFWLEQQDNKSTSGRRSEYATDYQCMLEEPHGEQSEQFRLIAKMHEKLNQYSEDDKTLYMKPSLILQNIRQSSYSDLDSSTAQGAGSFRSSRSPKLFRRRKHGS